MGENTKYSNSEEPGFESETLLLTIEGRDLTNSAITALTLLLFFIRPITMKFSKERKILLTLFTCVSRVTNWAAAYTIQAAATILTTRCTHLRNTATTWVLTCSTAFVTITARGITRTCTLRARASSHSNGKLANWTSALNNERTRSHLQQYVLS